MDEIIFSLLENLPTIILFVVIVVTLNTLGKGADILVEEAVKISISWGVSKTIIGATIVSLGTTIPEVTVSVAASLKGFSDMAIGNAVGSIITNTALIIGIVSIVGFVPVEKEVVDRQGKVQLFSIVTLFILSLRIFGGSNISRLMGIFLLILLVVYTIITISWSKKGDVEYDESYEDVDDSVISQVLMMVLGLFIVIISSKILIPSVEIVATRIGIPQSVIAATLIAFGTSLP
ncbi:MAG TPA: sodium:calcium antiporter, partial [Tissierellaceae bacterium]